MPQNAIFSEGSTSAIFLEYKINTDADISNLKKSLIKVLEMSSDQLQILMSFNKSGYKKLGGSAPEGLVDFEALIGLKNLKMPGTQSEILIWAHGHSKSAVFDFILNSKKLLKPFLTIE